MLAIEERGGTLVFAFSGRLDTVDCLEFDARLAAAAEATSLPVVFDLNGVDYVASMFLRVCVRTATQVGFERLRLVNVGPAVKRVLKIAGLDVHLTME